MHLVAFVRPSVCQWTLFCLRGARVITSLRCLCVGNQWACVDNHTDAVDRLLIIFLVTVYDSSFYSGRKCKFLVAVHSRALYFTAITRLADTKIKRDRIEHWMNPSGYFMDGQIWIQDYRVVNRGLLMFHILISVSTC